jgi:hypothetical protein
MRTTSMIVTALRFDRISGLRSQHGHQSSSTNRAVSTKGVLGFAGHFEKMLYDNAQLARVYLHTWQVTGVPFYHTIAEETLDYVVHK